MRIAALISLSLVAACGNPEQEAREDAAAQEDAIVSAQTGQQYDGKGPREQAAEKLGEAYDPSVEAVASSPNSPVEADLPAAVPDAPGTTK